MKPRLILIISLFTNLIVVAQNYDDPVDSLVSAMPLSENEWLIGLVIEEGNYIPLFDSLGNPGSEDRSGVYLFSKVDNKCMLHHYQKLYEKDLPGYKLQIKDLTEINEGSITYFTRDSIELARSEGIYPYIYLLNSQKVFSVINPSLHETQYRICFRNQNYYSWNTFVELELRQKFSSGLNIPDNLNYQYNSQTFIFRAFYACLEVLKKLFKF